jgi:guanylate kinase
MSNRLTVLSGPSGVGKGTVVAAVREMYPHVWVSVSYTTRPPRPGETDGVEYRFIDRETFAGMIERGELLEYDEHFGNIYGTPLEPVRQHLAAGIPTLLEIELHGARQVRAAVPDTQLVFLKPPSWAELERRLAVRGTESPEVVAERLARARLEMAAEPEFDASIVNDDVRRAAAELVALIEAVCPPNQDQIDRQES